MKLSWKTELAAWLLLAGMFALAAIQWSATPGRVPVHWNIHQQVDRYGGRFEGLFALPLTALGIYLLMLLLPRIDPGRANYATFAGAFTTLRVALIGFLAAIYAVSQLSIRGVEMNLNVMALITGALLIVVGNVLGKIRPNWFIGIRTPWTLSSKDAWVRAHRLGGWVLIAGGLVFMAAGVVGAEWAMWAASATLGVGMLGVTVYSYFVWRADPDKVPPAGTTPASPAP
jgi:uncharacterized membrane protein